MPKYPNIEVELVGQDGNAFAVLGNVKGALRAARVPKEEIDLFLKEAMSGDYWHLLSVVMDWVTVTGEDVDDSEDEDWDDEDGDHGWNSRYEDDNPDWDDDEALV